MNILEYAKMKKILGGGGGGSSGSAVMKELIVKGGGTYTPRKNAEIEVGNVVWFKETITIDDIPSDIISEGFFEFGELFTTDICCIEVYETGFLVVVAHKNDENKEIHYYSSVEVIEELDAQLPCAGWYLIEYLPESSIVTPCDAPHITAAETSIDAVKHVQSLFDNNSYDGFNKVVIDAFDHLVKPFNNLWTVSSLDNTEVTVFGEVAMTGNLYNGIENPEMCKKVYVLNGTSRISNSAFRNLQNLEKIVLPPSITEIDTAFAAYTKTKTIEISALTPPTIKDNTFLHMGELCQIVVPNGCGEAYKSATNWSVYADIIVEGVL